VREPYATLFGGLEGHWMLGQHLRRDVPDWDAIIADRRWESLSAGEQILVWVGLAIWNGNRTARIADLAVLDQENRERALTALWKAAT
jgi:hypothetical protein